MGGGLRRLRVLDRDYPSPLRDLPFPPDPFCIEGELLAGPAVAIVGTRKPSPEALAYTRQLAGGLARSGVQVWSGGALGIDAAAHEGALDAGGISVAVVGTGLEHCYPPEHGPLYARIIERGGALVSPFDPDQHATLTTFPQRNAVLAALTHATIVIQAPIKSGARSTARWARRLGRPLFVVPMSPWDPLGEGNCAELRLGGLPLVDVGQLLHRLPAFAGGPTAAEVLARPAHLRVSKEGASRLAGCEASEEPSLTMDGPAQAVLRLATETPRHLDDFCLATGFSTGQVYEALLTLTLKAVLVEGPIGWFRTASTRNT